MRLLAAPDKFRGTLTAREAAAAIAAGAERAGWAADELPLADGGEGTLDVLGGGNRRTLVSGPLGEPVEAAWRLEEDGTALIEAAQACGLTLAGGPEGNDPLRATSRGVGELVAAAVAEGAERIVVAVGGVASTDGGVGATEAVPHPLLVPLEVACDVDARFLDAADVFAPQKGATPEQVQILRERLARLVVPDLPGSGAAGGLAGGLAAIGARLLPGFDLVADRLGLDGRLAEADLVVTGEGLVDATSFTGKVVGRVLERAQAAGIEALVLAGDVAEGSPTERALARRELRSRARAHRAGGVRHGARRSDPGDPPKRALSCLPEMPKPVANAPHIAYRPGLDGLRAIAVASVFLYHSRIDWLPGGFLGVDLFFVLSGYLITSLLLVEWEARNQIDLRRFWLRRARRLLPALVVVVLAVAHPRVDLRAPGPRAARAATRSARSSTTRTGTRSSRTTRTST